MISANARHGFDRLLIQAVRAGMAAPDGAAVEVTPVANLDGAGHTHLVMLTLSSYLFRAMVLIHFTPDAASRAHFARLQNIDAAALGRQELYDAVAECGNLCSGILNRELARFFPHIGMSTPNILGRHCADHLDRLGADHVAHFRADAGAAQSFHLTLCVCAYADLDFCVSVEDAETETGELELF